MPEVVAHHGIGTSRFLCGSLWVMSCLRVWKFKSATEETACFHFVELSKTQIIYFFQMHSGIISLGMCVWRYLVERALASFAAFHILSRRLTELSRKVAWLIFTSLSWALWNIINNAFIEGIFIKHSIDALYKVIIIITVVETIEQNHEAFAIETLCDKLREQAEALRRKAAIMEGDQAQMIVVYLQSSFVSSFVGLCAMALQVYIEPFVFCVIEPCSTALSALVC